MITDPTFVGYVNNNVEIGDICANELSAVHMAANGTLFDVTINGQDYVECIHARFSIRN